MTAESQRAARLAGLSARWRPLLRRAYAGDLRAAIRCSCLVCSDWNAAAVRRCLDLACPLFRFRLGRPR